jgi:hypothetical protein
MTDAFFDANPDLLGDPTTTNAYIGEKYHEFTVSWSLGQSATGKSFKGD